MGIFSRSLEHKKLSSRRVVSILGKDGLSRPNVGDGFPRSEDMVKHSPMSLASPVGTVDEIILSPHRKFSDSPKMFGFVDYCFFTGSFLDWLNAGGKVSRVLVFCENPKYIEETLLMVDSVRDHRGMARGELKLVGAVNEWAKNALTREWHGVSLEGLA